MDTCGNAVYPNNGNASGQHFYTGGAWDKSLSDLLRASLEYLDPAQGYGEDECSAYNCELDDSTGIAYKIEE